MYNVDRIKRQLQVKHCVFTMALSYRTVRYTSHEYHKCQHMNIAYINCCAIHIRTLLCKFIERERLAIACINARTDGTRNIKININNGNNKFCINQLNSTIPDRSRNPVKLTTTHEYIYIFYGDK